MEVEIVLRKFLGRLLVELDWLELILEFGGKVENLLDFDQVSVICIVCCGGLEEGVAAPLVVELLKRGWFEVVREVQELDVFVPEAFYAV